MYTIQVITSSAVFAEEPVCFLQNLEGVKDQTHIEGFFWNALTSYSYHPQDIQGRLPDIAILHCLVGPSTSMAHKLAGRGVLTIIHTQMPPAYPKPGGIMCAGPVVHFRPKGSRLAAGNESYAPLGEEVKRLLAILASRQPSGQVQAPA